MARLTIRNVEPLELVFADGETKIALFNNEAFIIYTEEFGDILKDMDVEIEERPFEFGAKMLYCGLKVTEPSITLEEAQNIVYRGGLDLIQEIFILIIDNFLESSNEETKKKFQAMMTSEMEEAYKALKLK